jgi:DNA-binding transcriptional MerR regulator
VNKFTHLVKDAREIFEHWQVELDHPRSVFDIKRRQRIAARLKEGFTVEDLKQVCKGVKNSPWHMGENPSQTKYDSINVIYRDAEQVEKFLELAQEKKKKESHNSVGNPYSELEFQRRLIQQ